LEEQLKRNVSTDDVPPVVVSDINEYHNINMIVPKFEHLGNKLKYSWTNNTTPGSPQKRGPKLVNQRLSRIITDQKIFAYREPRQTIGRDYEFCILVDASGSMGGEKIAQAAKAGYTAWRSLRIANVPATLLAHTGISDFHTYEKPVVYVIATMHEKRFDIVQKRAGALLSGAIRLQNNYDGYAILKAAEIGFSKEKSKKRYLFVISDGEPSGHGYGGEYALKHTQRSVEQVRMRGIRVISITVDRGAYSANDMIYGKSQNVKASASNALDELIEALFVKRV
jgi:nitric oxide reductase activation protein